MIDPVTVSGNTYDRIHMIQNGDPSAGFSALITYALNGARRAETRNWLPVVYFSGEATPHFFEPEYGDNVWEYYFEPIFGISYDTLKSWLDSGRIAPNQVHQFSDAEVVDWHVNDPERITTFWARDKVSNRGAWMEEKRRLGREYVKRYIRPVPRIVEKTRGLYNTLIDPHFTFGVHIRGTDFSYARPTSPDEYFRAIDSKATELQLTDYRIFLATDQSQFVTEFEARFPGRIITCDAIRSVNDIAPFQLKDVSPYQKGEDVLLDIMLLSQCQHLFKGASAVGEYAMWFNPELQCTDFALTSEFESDNSMFWVGAYLKLDVDNKGFWQVTQKTWIRIFKQMMERIRNRLGRVLQ